MKIFISFFLTLFLFTQNAQAAIATSSTNLSEIKTEHFSKKEKKKVRRWQKLKAKWNKFTAKKERKNKYGRLGLIVLLAGIASLVIFDGLFLLALLGAVVLGAIGLAKDERKTAAWIAVALPIVFVTIALIAAFDSLD